MCTRLQGGVKWTGSAEGGSEDDGRARGGSDGDGKAKGGSDDDGGAKGGSVQPGIATTKSNVRGVGGRCNDIQHPTESESKVPRVGREEFRSSARVQGSVMGTGPDPGSCYPPGSNMGSGVGAGPGAEIE